MSTHPEIVALRELHSALTPALPTVSVDLGPVVTDSSRLDVLAVGTQPAGLTALSGDRRLGMDGMVEHAIDIPCIALSVLGENSDPLARMQRCYELLDEVGRVVDALRRRSTGPVVWGQITRHEAQWATTKTGRGAQVLFSVSATAFTDPQEE